MADKPLTKHPHKLFTNKDSFSFSSKPNLKKLLEKKKKMADIDVQNQVARDLRHQLAMQSLIEKVSKSPRTTNPLSTLIDSFVDYQCKPTPSVYQFVIKALTKNPCNYDLIPKVPNLL